jgi:hypothetical protein
MIEDEKTNNKETMLRSSKYIVVGEAFFQLFLDGRRAYKHIAIIIKEESDKIAESILPTLGTTVTVS